MSYLVHKERQALIINSTEPDRLLASGASATKIEYKGRPLVVVPHTLANVQILRKLGYQLPSPIGFYYDWPREKGEVPNPFSHQLETSAFLTLNKKAFCFNEIGCVDADTEYLSPKGWRRMDQYDGGLVAQYNLNGTTSFVQPEEYVKKPCADMIRIKTKYGIDQLLSPEHRVLYVSSTGTTQVDNAANIYRRNAEAERGWAGRIITTFAPTHGTYIPLSDAELRVQVSVIADGYFPSPSTKRCHVCVKKERKKERIRELLRTAGIDFLEREHSKPGYTLFVFSAPWRTKIFDETFWLASPEQLKTIADELVHWDGTQRKAGGSTFSTYERQSADFAQYAYAASGRTASLSIHTRERRGAVETEYVVHARPNAALLYAKGWDGVNKTQTMWYEPSTDGFKYCFMVPSTFLLFRRNGCIFASGNTGKTLSALWAADYLLQSKLIRKVLIISPLSTIDRVWGDSVFIHMGHRQLAVLHGTAAKRKKLFADDKYDFYVINPDALDIITELSFKEKRARQDPMDRNSPEVVTRRLVDADFLRKDIDLVIVDELAMYRNGTTNRWRILNHAIKKDMWVWGMTGTPTPNEPCDAWAQIKLVTPERVPSNFTMFKSQTMQQLTEYIWVPRKEAPEIVHQAMQPAIRFVRDECFDLPPCTYSYRQVELSDEQKKHYKEVATNLTTEIKGGLITAMNEGVKAGKLIQIVCGVVYDKNGIEREIDAKARIKAVQEIIEQAGHKVIVFVPFTAPLKMIKRELEKTFTCEIVYGGTSSSERGKIFAAFQSTKDPKVLIADAGCMSHGLTLTEANTIVWYGPEWSNDTYTQANGRITRPGQKNAQHIIHIASTEIEKRIYKKLQERGKVQNILLEMVQRGVPLI